MTFPILGGNGAVGGYAIDNSLRFNDNDSAYLSRTPASAGNRKTWTWSGWVKRGNIDTTQRIIASGENPWNNPSGQIYFISSGELSVFGFTTGTEYQVNTNRLFRDVSAWYHIVVVFDTTQATASDRIKIYVNGTQETSFSVSTYPSLNHDGVINNTKQHNIGSAISTSFFDGYMAECNFIDGQQLSPTDFGEFDEDSGIWKPIRYSGSYGTNGFYLDFENSGSLGADQSGNGNNFTPTNLASTDQTTDTPTNNFATLNPLTFDSSGMTFSEGNTKVIGVAGSNSTAVSTQSFSSGKWYAEFKIGNTHKTRLGAKGTDWYDKNNTQIGTVYDHNGYIYIGTQESGSDDLTPPSYTTGDIIGVFVDKDNNTIKFSKNGTVHSVSQTLSQDEYAFYVFDYSGTGDNQLSVEANFGNPSFTISSGNSDANGYGNFEYSPNDGTYDYLALCTQNLATALSPTIDDGSAYFHTQLYTGTGSALSITNDANAGDFQPDWIWLKSRSNATNHNVFDSSRGQTKRLYPNLTDAEDTVSGFTLDSNGFSTGTSSVGDINVSSQTYVAWQWKANGGTTSSNTDGDITTTVQANITSGFSILTWTGNGTASQSLGHGLGVTPKIMIQKNRDQVEGWQIFGSTLFDRLQFDTGAEDANLPCTFSSTTITLPNLSNNNAFNSSGDNFVSYVFAEIEGYSKFGSYTGNGSADGTFVYTGFRPAWVMTKGSSTAQAWSMRDNKRDSYNSAQKAIYANLSDAESDNANNSIDLLSNGFKIRNLFGTENSSGQTYIYLAFAENPFVSSSGVPVVAR